MAVYTIESPEGVKFNLEGDSPPTEQELEVVFASLPATTVSSGTPTLTPEQSFAQQFTTEAQAPLLRRISRLPGQAIDLGSAILETVAGGAGGVGEIFGRASVPSTEAPGLREAISTAITASIPGVSVIPGVRETIARALPDLAQTAIEAAPRAAIDLGGVIRQAVEFAAQEPGTVGQALIPGIGPLLALQGRTPTPEDISRAFGRSEEATRLAAATEQPIVPEIIGEANIPLARAIPLIPGAEAVVPALAAGARIIPAVARAAVRPVERAIARGFTPSVTERATGLLGITQQEGVEQLLATAKPRIIESYGKAPKTAEEGIRAATQTENQLYKQTLENLNQAKEQGLVMKGQNALTRVEEEIRAIPTLTEQQADDIISQYNRFGRDLDPIEGQTLLKRLNKELTAFYEKEGVSKATAQANPEIAAKVAFRDSLSDQLDDLVKTVTGKNSSPYRDIGQVIEFKGGLRSTVNRIQRGEGMEAIGAGIGPGGVPLTRAAIARRAIRTVARPLIKGELEKADDALQSVFREGPSQVLAPDLPVETVASLRNQYLPSSQASVGASLEDQIESLIRTYPASLRRDPRLARLAAETQLSQGAQ